MKVSRPSAGERAPFLFMGILCWLCGAVVVAVVTKFLLGWVPAAVAVVVLTAVVLAVSWSLSSSAFVSKR